jgi:hypothetical protein
MTGPLCRHCHRRQALPGRRGLCATCHRDRAVRDLYPRTDAAPADHDAGEPSAEDLERTIAEQAAALPAWWHLDAKRMRFGREQAKLVAMLTRPAQRRDRRGKFATGKSPS